MTHKINTPSSEQIVLTYQRDVWRFLVALGCRPIEADDLTQETFISVVVGGFEYRGDAELRSLLFTVAKRAFITTIRKRGRSPLVANLDDVDSDWIKFQEECPSDRRVEFMRECLETVDSRSYRALMMRYQGGLSISEIADKLEYGEEGTKSLLRRLKSRLRDCVTRKVAKDG
ncbi:MAG: sigma-70 family RNA polymerase sigma factor [Planctomycetota bacterium]